MIPSASIAVIAWSPRMIVRVLTRRKVSGTQMPKMMIRAAQT
jgi:hypothetical protein